MLATVIDLAARNITVPDAVDPDTVLASATDAVRDAAGCPISQTTSTVTLVVYDALVIDLPAGPVQSVASVVVGGVPVTGWAKIGDTVAMPYRWTTVLPVEVDVTYTHGLPIVPKDIVDLVCSVAAMGMPGGDSYGAASRLGQFRLGDFSETYVHPAGTESPSPVAIPDAVRCALRARFNTGTTVVITR